MRRILVLARLISVLAMPLASTASQAASAAPSSTPQVLTLSQAWLAALEHDPTYKAAISEREAGQANRAIGRAGLLPQVSATLNRNKINGTVEEPGRFGDTVESDLDYTSRADEIRATQTVFNWSTIAAYRQGQSRADYSLAVFDTKAKDTSIRLISRYFQTLLAYEQTAIAESKLQANEKQITVAQRRYDSGEGTVTDVRESKSRRDLARADLIQAQDELVVAQRELQEMVGVAPRRLTAVKSDFMPQPLNPGSREDWLAASMAHNAEIRSGELALRVSAQEVDRTFGGHLPTLDLVAARRKVEGETVSTRDQHSTSTSVGFQLALPIYSGGLTSAQVEQAGHFRDQSAQELAATRERVAVEVTRQYQAVVSGAQRIEALVLAVASSAEALEAVEMGYQAGTRSIVDILDSQDQLYRSRLDLTRARLEYVLARLNLAGAASMLDAGTIEAASRTYFGPDQIVLR